jgi:putative colanic acid biosynthesis glycosyltransferase WcaI
LTTQANPSVVFLNRFYAPDIAATGQMLSDLAEDLSAAGWSATVITSQSSYEGDMRDFRKKEVRNGVHVYRVAATHFGRNTMAGRMFDYASYMLLSFATLFRIPRPQIVVAMSDPPFILFTAVVAARVRRAAVCYWAQDVYPTLAAKLGVLDEYGAPFKLLSAVARRLQRGCDLIVGLGPEMVKALVRGGAPQNRTICIHNWADEKAILPILPADNWFLTANNLQGKFVVLYSGNAGRGHTFEALCEAMFRCRNDERIVFVFIGAGRKSHEIRAYAQAQNLSNVLFFDYLPRSELSYSLSAASVSIVTEDPAVAGLLLPSKTYGILASGRPIIFIGAAESDVAHLVRSTRCGVVIHPDDPDGLENAIRLLARDADQRARMGDAARRASENVYSRGRSAGEWSAALKSVLPPDLRAS